MGRDALQVALEVEPGDDAVEVTVEDAGAFTTPWKATITYLRAGHTDWQERVCAENVQHYYTGAHYYSDNDARIPTAEKPDF